MMIPVVYYLIVLLLTVGVEMLVVMGLGLLGRSRETTRLGLACLFLNLTTHPLATLVRIILGAPIVSIEVLIVGFEAFGYSVLGGQPIARSIMLSLIANLSSLGVGVLLLASQSLA